MKNVLFLALILLVRVHCYCQSNALIAKPESGTIASASGGVKNAVVNVLWLGPKPVKIAINDEQFFFTPWQKRQLSFYSGKSYSLKAIKPVKTYAYKADVTFDKGEQTISLEIVNDFLTGSFPDKVINRLNSEMVLVEGGSFTMGCNNPVDSDCIKIWKQQKTGLSSFYIGKFDITQNQWEAVMGNNPSHFTNCGDCPVEVVSWNDVQKFISRLNEVSTKKYRLPTEAEWEYAARGGNKSRGYKYAGSNNLDSVAWYSGNSQSTTHPVGRKAPNELGLFDMSGNVAQWCSDWYNEEYIGRRPGNNPKGGENGLYRIVRGCSWLNLAVNCNVLHRDWIYPGVADALGGFKLVQDF